VLGLDTNAKGVIAYRPIGQMPSHQDSRKRLIQTALKLFASRGYHNTSIADILRQSGCKRGSLYYYFSSKEELGHAVIDEELRLLAEQGAGSHLQTNEHPIDRLLKTLDDVPAVLKLETIGSVATAIGVRMATSEEGFRERLGGRLEAMMEQVEEMVRRGIADGQIVDSVDPRQLAHVMATVSAGIQNASLLWKREVIWEDTRLWLKEYLNSLRR
jgi:AcrR family transcriptional regulator